MTLTENGCDVCATVSAGEGWKMLARTKLLSYYPLPTRNGGTHPRKNESSARRRFQEHRTPLTKPCQSRPFHSTTIGIPSLEWLALQLFRGQARRTAGNVGAGKVKLAMSCFGLFFPRHVVTHGQFCTLACVGVVGGFSTPLTLRILSSICRTDTTSLQNPTTECGFASIPAVSLRQDETHGTCPILRGYGISRHSVDIRSPLMTV